MVTRYRVETNRPTERLSLHVSSVSPLPKSYRDAFNDSNWKNAIRDEYHALIKNNTWTLVPRPMDINIVRYMWLFRHKYHADDTLSRYKARILANGSTQLKGVDVDETFSPVVKPDTIQTVLRMFLSQKKYVVEILERAHMVNCNPSRNPVDTESKLGIDGDPVSDLTLYRSLADMEDDVDISALTMESIALIPDDIKPGILNLKIGDDVKFEIVSLKILSRT
ncbi:ribonuclease H-like domain-containing protein [Tanacetum coccineum]